MDPEPDETSERQRAPGRLALIQDLINSYDIDHGVEELPDLDALGAWLRERELIDPDDRLAEGDLARARAFREALRALLDERGHGGVRAETAAAVNDAVRPSVLRMAVDGAGAARLIPAASGVDRALGELSAIIAEAALDGTWPRLKVCHEDTCRWAFYDRSKNRSGSWCSMAVCGNRSKARNYRARQRGVPAQG